MVMSLCRKNCICGHIGKATLANGARVAELADALDLGSSPLRRVGVRVPSLAPNNIPHSER